MSLSAKESAYARELLAREERTWRNWGLVRWLALLVGIATLAVGISLISRSQQLAPELSIDNAKASTLPASLSSVQNDLIMVRNDMTQFARTCALFSAIGMGFVAAGVVIVGYSITHWNTHLRDGLMVKAIREKFREELAAAA